MTRSYVRYEQDIAPCGYNPEFVRRVHERRRTAQHLAKGAERREAARKPELPSSAPADVWREFRQWLAASPEPSRRPVSAIVAEEAERWCVLPSQIKGPRRTVLIVAIRQTAMARAYVERPDLSTTYIGRQFGGRDRTTVLHAVRKAGVHRGSHGA